MYFATQKNLKCCQFIQAEPRKPQQTDTQLQSTESQRSLCVSRGDKSKEAELFMCSEIRQWTAGIKAKEQQQCFEAKAADGRQTVLTLAELCSNDWTTALPMPWAPPVTRATFPYRDMIPAQQQNQFHFFLPTLSLYASSAAAPSALSLLSLSHSAVFLSCPPLWV